VPKQSSHDKENALIQAVAADWVNPDLTATSYDKSGQVLGYRRRGAPITAEEIVWFDSLAIARSASSGATISAVHIIHADHLNSPRALSNARLQSGQAAGITIWRWDLVAANATGSNAFGSFAANEDPDLNGSSVKFDLRFLGQQNDSETGLSYNYSRDYESGAGRYVESDPIGLTGGVSTFGYGLNSPLQFSDPFSLLVYHCSRPMKGLLRLVIPHHFVCATSPFPGMPPICGGHGPAPDDYIWGLGNDTNETYNPKQCTPTSQGLKNREETCVL